MKKKKASNRAGTGVASPAAGRGTILPIGRLTRANVIKWALAALFFAVFVLMILLVNAQDPDSLLDGRNRAYVPARVTAVLADNAEPDTWTEGRRLGSQLLELEILSGAHKSERLTATNYLSAYFNIDAKVGTRIIVLTDYDEDGKVYIATLFNRDRGIALGGFALLFALLLIVIGGKKGIKALLGLLFTLASLWFLLIPLILKGYPAIPVTIFIVVLTTAACLLLLNGPTDKTLCAVLGCVGGVTAAGLFAVAMGAITALNGFNMNEASDIILRSPGSGTINVSGLLVCGIIIASLGAAMDVAMAISSAIYEIHTLNPKLPPAALFRSGMNIGRDAMGTMTNTLILAFVGASINTLILFQIFRFPMIQILNSDLMSIEILQGIAGSMGIILTTPLVAFISAQILPRRKKRDVSKQ